MANKSKYKCEGIIYLKRDNEDFTTFVYVESNFYEATIQDATKWLEDMLSKYAACYAIDSSYSKVGFEVTAVKSA